MRCVIKSGPWLNQARMSILSTNRRRMDYMLGQTDGDPVDAGGDLSLLFAVDVIFMPVL